MEDNFEYFRFPLFLLRDLFIDKNQTLNNIIRYGIYDFSKRIEYDLPNVAKQCMYGYYRKPITSDLKQALQSYIVSDLIDLDEDYNGFNGAEFNPETEIEQLLEIFENDIDFKEKAIEFYQVKQAYKILGINGDFDNCLKVAKLIENSTPGSEAFPMINKSLVFDFRDNEKSEFDLIQFAAYISVRSIIGIKDHCKTNKPMIISRMFGYKSTKHLPDNMEPIIKELFQKYSNRYHIDKVMMFLESDWNILTYSNNMRGMYISTGKKKTIDSLAVIAESKKRKNKFDKIKQKKNEAKAKALQQLNKGLQLNKES